MWKIFNKKEVNLEKALLSIEEWKEEIFSLLEIKVKEYFAKKMIIYFDNNMIFEQKRGVHFNLMDALSNAEKEMLNVQGVFGRIELYWLRENDEHTLIIYGIDDDKEYTLHNNGFKLVQRDAMPSSNKMEGLEKSSWKTLVFDVELVNYSSGWINYTPSLEMRSILQAEHILLNMHFKKENMSLLERIQFEKNVRSHPSYEALYQKVLRIMPKIETSLEQEWKSGVLPIVIEETIKKNKSKKKI